jgi:flagellar hook assembly protein FlgD
MEGTQLYKITKAEEKANQAGDPMWFITFTCQASTEDKGKEFNAFYSLSDAARWKLNELLDSIRAPKTGRMEAVGLIGKTVRIAVQHGEYNGRKTANVYQMFPADSTDNPIIPEYKKQEAKPLSGTRPEAPKF